MEIRSACYQLGPGDATLTLQTGRHGAAARAGHDLMIEVRAWSATLDLRADHAASTLVLIADATSLHVLHGSAGAQQLGDDDKADIRKTIYASVLGNAAIEFRSTVISGSHDGLAVTGDLVIGHETHPVEFTIAHDNGRFQASTIVKQSDWGIAPYSALAGGLRVNDGVVVEAAGRLPDERHAADGRPSPPVTAFDVLQ